MRINPKKYKIMFSLLLLFWSLPIKKSKNSEQIVQKLHKCEIRQQNHYLIKIFRQQCRVAFKRGVHSTCIPFGNCEEWLERGLGGHIIPDLLNLGGNHGKNTV